MYEDSGHFMPCNFKEYLDELLFLSLLKNSFDVMFTLWLLWNYVCEVSNLMYLFVGIPSN